MIKKLKILSVSTTIHKKNHGIVQAELWLGLSSILFHDINNSNFFVFTSFNVNHG